MSLASRGQPVTSAVTARSDTTVSGPATIAEILADAPPPRVRDGDTAREQIRQLRRQAGTLLAALDDDPTGSQSVHGVQLVTVPSRTLYDDAIGDSSDAVFVLTNTRSLGESAAVDRTVEVARDLWQVADDRGRRLQLLTRSDSTLRGHVLAEVEGLQQVQRERHDRGFDAVLFAPAYIEAGRVTAADIHWARIGSQFVPVGETEFARDATFGFRSSNLPDFLAEKAGRPVPWRSLSLTDIRAGGPDWVREILADTRDGGWVIVNATEYSDLETVAQGVLAAETDGRSFVFRTGPSFVRALAGITPSTPLRSAQIWPDGPPAGHGLVVVGSHVGQSTRQLDVLRQRSGIAAFELDVAALIRGEDVVPTLAAQAARQLSHSDVVIYTSRSPLTGTDGDASLAVARLVSEAVATTVKGTLAARPAWVVGKGGITSHDVAMHGLGIRRAQVLGQMLPGMVSVLRPLDAPAQVIGMPYVIFAGNVGDDYALSHVVGVLRGEEGS